MVGILASQTLGEISTQMTLNTFHLSGVGAGSVVITKGIPRLKEIIEVTRSDRMKSKNMEIYLNKSIASDEVKVKHLKTLFNFTKLIDLVSKTEIIVDSDINDSVITEDIAFIKTFNDFSKLFNIESCENSTLSPWVLRITFNKDAILNRNITMAEIQETILQKTNMEDEIQCSFSDDNSNDLILRLRIRHDNNENFINFMKDIEKALLDLRIRGIPGIVKVESTEMDVVKYNLDGSYMKSKEWVIKTEGSNLLDVLSHDDVDSTRTISNDIWEIYEVFGIEAAREKIFTELLEVFSGSSPNHRHIELIADVMTYRGKLMQIDRHGINRNTETGPIAKASFEEVMNIFVKSAIFAETDKIKGVSANILAGQFCNCGTNNFDILLDEENLFKYCIDTPDDISMTEPVNYDFNTIEQKIDTLISDKNATKINQDSFEFGFNFDNKTEFKLNPTTTSIKSSLKIIDAENGSIINKEIDIDINKDKDYTEETIDNSLNENADNINIVKNISNNEKIKLKQELEGLNILESNTEINTKNNAKNKKIKIVKTKK